MIKVTAISILALLAIKSLWYLITFIRFFYYEIEREARKNESER